MAVARHEIGSNGMASCAGVCTGRWWKRGSWNSWVLGNPVWELSVYCKPDIAFWIGQGINLINKTITSPPRVNHPSPPQEQALKPKPKAVYFVT